jgi:hypothetical protein
LIFAGFFSSASRNFARRELLGKYITGANILQTVYCFLTPFKRHGFPRRFEGFRCQPKRDILGKIHYGKEPGYMGILPMDIDILPPSDDRIFKLLLTSSEGKPVLMDLISAIIQRPVVDVIVMTDLEKWALFLQYANVPEYREAVNKVIDSKEALQMAGNLLMSVSKDERERAVFRSRRMYQTDMQSNLATAEDRGEQRGLQKGLQEGLQKGLQEGTFAIARNMIIAGEPLEKVILYTGLTREEVESLGV